MRVQRGVSVLQAVCLFLMFADGAAGQQSAGPSERRPDRSAASDGTEVRPPERASRRRPAEDRTAMADAPIAIGRVVDYEAGRSITLEASTRAGVIRHEFAIVAEQTRIELPRGIQEITLDMMLAVWVDENDTGIAARIAPPPGRADSRANRRSQRPADAPPQATGDPAIVSSTPARPAVRREPGLSPAEAALRIDAEIGARLAAAEQQPAPVCDDAEFVRRIWLDIVGVIPPAETVAEFLADRDPDKRQAQIDALLSDARYGLHFGELWSDRIVPRDLPLDPVPLRLWLADRLNAGQGWNDVVSELVTAEGSFSPIRLRRGGSAHDPPATFLLSNSEENQPRPDRLAAAGAALFLGVQVQCAECHDHPFADWKQTDFWGLAALFGQLRAAPQDEQSRDWIWIETPPAPGEPVSIIIPSTALLAVGETVPASFLGDVPDADRIAGPSEGTGHDDPPKLRESLAAWMTSAGNPYFGRAAVNRIWADFFGRGLVNPIDDLRHDNPPSHPAVLDLLAAEFTKSGFDLKYLIRCLCLSESYQRSSRLPGTSDADQQSYARMPVKVMGPGALYDSLTAATGFRDLQLGLPRSTSKQGVTTQLTPRAAFIDFFQTQNDDSRTTEYSQGIPQALKLLNAQQLNGSFPVVQRLARSGLDRGQMVEHVYFTALARRPTAEESRLVLEFLAARGDNDPEQDYSAVLWALLNSSEFVLNQ